MLQWITLQLVPYIGHIIKELLSPNTIVIGDLNKFDADQGIFDCIFRKHKDLISTDMETFVSFDGDRQPSIDGNIGSLWRSSLDGVILDPNYFDGEVDITSTEHPPRVSDHFFIVTRIFASGLFYRLKAS